MLQCYKNTLPNKARDKTRHSAINYKRSGMFLNNNNKILRPLRFGDHTRPYRRPADTPAGGLRCCAPDRTAADRAAA